MAISFNTSISINDAYLLVKTLGETNTILFCGEPGIGKSSIHYRLKEEDTATNGAGNEVYDDIYLDWSNIDMGDLFIRAPNRETGELDFYPSSIFRLNSPKPKRIMIDELAKGDKMMQKMAMRLVLEHYAGDVKLPPGSVVFATTNNFTDGVGDNILAHGGNRMVIVQVQKPTERVWLPWANDNGISSVLRAWVAMNPRCLASYLDGGQDENPFIFSPSKRNLSFVSPRSLAKADNIVRKRDLIGPTLTHAALSGTIGLAAAESLAAFLVMEKQLVSVRDILKSPDTIELPHDTAALLMTMFNAIDIIETQDDLSNFMRFINRVPSSELKAVFFTMLVQSKRTVRLAKSNSEVMTWVKGNIELVV
jgi:hypothetical protein